MLKSVKINAKFPPTLHSSITIDTFVPDTPGLYPVPVSRHFNCTIFISPFLCVEVKHLISFNKALDPTRQLCRGDLNFATDHAVIVIKWSIYLFNYFIYLWFYVTFNTVQVIDITMDSWKGRGNQYIQLVKVLYCKLPTNGKQLPAFPLEEVPGTEPRTQRSEARVLPLCHRGPFKWSKTLQDVKKFATFAIPVLGHSLLSPVIAIKRMLDTFRDSNKGPLFQITTAGGRAPLRESTTRKKSLQPLIFTLL